jgi:hypothetical protein
MSAYREARKAIVEQTEDTPPCRFCSTPTKRETLADLGRCFPCYQAYCRQEHDYPDVGNKHARGPRDWAHALKRRHDAGVRLTPAQVSAYRDTLRLEGVEA